MNICICVYIYIYTYIHIYIYLHIISPFIPEKLPIHHGALTGRAAIVDIWWFPWGIPNSWMVYGKSGRKMDGL